MGSVRLNKKFYGKKAVIKAIDDFSHITSFKLKEEKDALIVEFESKKDIDLRGEFCNYVLAMMR